MAAKEMDDGEFWLPSDFLGDDFFDMESEEEERISLPIQTHFKNTPKLATSPQSTLYGLGGRYFPSGGGGGGGGESPEAPSPSMLFTNLYEEVMRMGINGQIRKESVQEKAALIQQQLRTAQFYLLRRQQLMKLQQQQFDTAVASLGRRNTKSRTRGAYGAPPPNSNHNGSGMRAGFLNGSNGKMESTGTGVFLPRRAGTQNEPRKKSGCSAVILSQPRLPTGYVLDNDAAGHEMRLPQEWTY